MRITRVNSSESVVEWLRREADSQHLKVLAGPRGVGKTTALRSYCSLLRERGVDDGDIILLDFESAALRRLESYKEVIAIIRERRGARQSMLYLMLDEITALLDFPFLTAFLYSLPNCDLLVTTSNRRLGMDAAEGYFGDEISFCKMYPGDDLQRSEHELEAQWAIAFLRDVLGGDVLANASAVERLMDYLAAHMGDPVSRRKLAQNFRVGNHPLSPNTVQEYMKLLENAYLLESVPTWDTFEGCIAKNAGVRVFCTDLELRQRLCGDLPGEAERLAYNRKYLDLRVRHDHVYCERSDAAFPDFVIIDRDTTEVVKWKGS